MKTYLFLTKPGIITGNVITMSAGFALASKGHFHPYLFVATLLGLGFIIAAAGVLNNAWDRQMDAKMARTQKRALVQGTISLTKAFCFALLLVTMGIYILGVFTNLLTLSVALSGFLIYLVLYAYLKYRSFYGTLVGSLAGAIPPVVGYTAVSDTLDLGALLLFVVLVFWQMPHFFAIAILHLHDYKNASIPVMPLTHGLFLTQLHIIAYILAFLIAALLLTLTGYTGPLTFYSALFISFSWLILALCGFNTHNPHLWARHMFRFSLFAIFFLSVSISGDSHFFA